MTELMEPRTLCQPDDKVSPTEHKHLCPNCGTCWKHSNDMPLAGHAAFIEGHTCPNCGTEQRVKHITDEPVRLLTAHDLDCVAVILARHIMRERDKRLWREIADQFRGASF